MCHLLSRALDSWKQEKLVTEYFAPQSGQFLTLESLPIKIVLSRLPISEAHPITLLGPRSHMQSKEYQTDCLKGAMMVVYGTL